MMITTKIYSGVIASEGIAIGFIFVYTPTIILDKVKGPCTIDNVSVEILKLSRALEEYKKYLGSLQQISSSVARDILDAYELIAETITNEALELVKSNKVCGEFAVKVIYERYSEMLRQSKSELIALRESDLKSIASSLIENILRHGDSTFKTIPSGGIVVADELYPIEMLKLVGQGIKGIVTKKGGITSHVAIIARNNGIPYLIIPEIDLNQIKNYENHYAILDSLNGKFIINPDEESSKTYNSILARYMKVQEVVKRYAFMEAFTIDQDRIHVLCNVSNIEEARVASTAGCDGVGLFRVEFLYMSEKPPNYETLYNTFEKLAALFKNKPVIVRAPDLGADKPLPYIKLEEPNPFLGLRGIRLLLEYQEELFKPFIKAFLAIANKFNNVKLMFPMVSKVKEIYEVVELIEKVKDKYVEDFRKELKLGVMIETPAAALMIDKLAETGYISFISIGTNDLTQYVLAVDRTNAKLSRLYSEINPAVLRLIKIAVDQARRYNIGIEVCGEIASKQYAVPILLGLNIKELSVNPVVVGIIKYTISKLSSKNLENELIPELLRLYDEAEVLSKTKHYLRKVGVELLS